MKEKLECLTLCEKEIVMRNGSKRKEVTMLKIWDDNYLNDKYLEDTVILSLQYAMVKSESPFIVVKELDEDTAYLGGIYLTKGQAVLLRNYLDSFIQLAETKEELKIKNADS